VDEVMAQRAEDRVGERVRVLVEELDVDEDGGAVAVGRAGHQGPDDAATVISLGDLQVAVGDFVDALVVDVDGVDLLARPLESDS
jgi:ribosomal protein S12 methylthiotransferase